MVLIGTSRTTNTSLAASATGPEASQTTICHFTINVWAYMKISMLLYLNEFLFVEAYTIYGKTVSHLSHFTFFYLIQQNCIYKSILFHLNKL